MHHMLKYVKAAGRIEWNWWFNTNEINIESLLNIYAEYTVFDLKRTWINNKVLISAVFLSIFASFVVLSVNFRFSSINFEEKC